uniref:Uncharacterized protein n=1 Tax=Meloidogyne enterolobii TaxID=390850 RepID=A0A6V7TME5_MELEN|nr:unnamed protein product [Meloidogyne enterolobii]
MHHGGIYPDDPIKFEEYTSLRANIECIGLFKTFNEAFERLVNKIITFTRINLKNIKLPFENTEVIANELKDYDVSQKIRDSATSKDTEYYRELTNIVIKCKIFMADLHSKGSESSLIDIYSFMEKVPFELNSLKIIFNLSKIQSKEIDKAINEEIYNQHLENKNKLRKEIKNVIVEGNCPFGLYAAFELFMEGINVTVVSGLSSQEKDKIIYINKNQIPKLRFILGTEFDKFLNEQEKTQINNGINLNIKTFENALKERIKVLSEYVQAKEKINKDEESFLKLNFGTKVLDITTVNEKPKAILDKVDVEIPFDLFFCNFTKYIKQGSVILNKRDNKDKIFKESQFNMKIEMDSHILFKYFDKFIKKLDFLSKRIKKRYDYMHSLIYNGMEEIKDNSRSPLTRTGKVYKTLPNGQICYKFTSRSKTTVRIFETETKIQIYSETPMAIVELIEEVKNEREELEEINDEEYMKRKGELIIDEEKCNHEKELKEKLNDVKNKQKKILDEKLNGVNDLKKIKAIKNNNKKEENEKLDKIKNEKNKIWEEKLEKIKAVNLKLLEAGIKGERAKLLEKYDDFIVELKEKWFRAVFYHVFDEVYKTEDKKKVVIKLSKEEEKQNEKGKASTSNNIKTIQDKQEEHVLYFDKNSLIGKTFLLKIYGKENAVKLVKGKKDSEILVDISDENIADKMIEGLLDVDNAVSAIKEYNNSSEQMDLTKMLTEALKNKGSA